MDIIKELLHALWQHNIEILTASSLVWLIYLLVFIVLFLENALLPAAFLPGDSLLILVGVLIAKGILNFPITILLLTIAASLGSWLSYLQGKWLDNSPCIREWVAYLPVNYHQRAHMMFHRHDLTAFLAGRFIAFIRTLLPMIAGIYGMKNLRFHYFNWSSAFLWVFILTLIGVLLGCSTIFQRYEKNLMLCLMLLPLALFILGFISSVIVVWRKKRCNYINKR